MKKNFLTFNILIVSFYFSTILLTGCPTITPQNPTKLEIGGPLVTAVLEAWDEDWYKFEVENDNTSVLLIIKNMEDHESVYLGYQINLFWHVIGTTHLELIASEESSPTKNANPLNNEDKDRKTFVLPYKGTYYIRIYGYPSPISSGNKKYQLLYMIGLAKPETYKDATNIKDGDSKEVNVVGDILSIYKLLTSKGSIYKVSVANVTDPNIIENTSNTVVVNQIIQMKDGKTKSLLSFDEVFAEHNNFEEALQICGLPFNYNLTLHSSSKNEYYLILENLDEFGNAKVKITLTKFEIKSLQADKDTTVEVKGTTPQYVKLGVPPNKKYKITLDTMESLSKKVITITSNDQVGGITIGKDDWDYDSTNKNYTATFTVPSDSTDDYYLVLVGNAGTDASIRVILTTLK